ncbi:MAG: SMI1/KNR4 family protein [Pyrinomonadaceae bacterium]|nr:SMI1/KNR4 family protein [Pyrinomonadaceae bacterium]
MAYLELLRQVEQRIRTNKGRLQGPCEFESFGRLKTKSESELGSDLKSSFVRFLQRTNGFYWNHVYIFGSETCESSTQPGIVIPGFIQANLDYRRKDARFLNYLVFGKSSHDQFLFAYKIRLHEYQIIQESHDQIVDKVKSFDDMIAQALKRSLFAH